MLGGEEDPVEGPLSHVSHPAEKDFTPGKVAAVWGRQTDQDKFQPFFSGKGMNFDNHARFVNMPHSIGVHCQRGQKPHYPNQDDFFVLERKEWLLFGVLDGHGAEGHIVSHLGQEHLPKFVLQRFLPAAKDWKAAAIAAFEDVHCKIKADLGERANVSGSTASVALISRDAQDEGPLKLQSAFVGDSSMVYAKRAIGATSWEVEQLGSDHKPDREDESQRIRAAGGEVSPSSGPRYPARLQLLTGGLAMSRSLGDFEAATVGLVHTPEVPPEVVLEDGYEHLILICSDGVWDVIDAAQAVQLVGKFPPDDAQRAAEKLANKAQLRWQEQEDHVGVIDDITVILVRPGLRQMRGKKDSIAESKAE